MARFCALIALLAVGLSQSSRVAREQARDHFGEMQETLADFMLTQKTESQNASLSEGGSAQCAFLPRQFCCNVGTPCKCGVPPGNGNCAQEAFLYCCGVGTPCIC